MTLDPRIYRTGNTVPSSATQDLRDDTRILDVILNDTSGEDVYNRLGDATIKTWNTLSDEVDAVVDELNTSLDTLDIKSIARANNVEESLVALLVAGTTLSGEQYLYDTTAETTYYSPVALTGMLSAIGTDVNGVRTVTVGGSPYVISSSLTKNYQSVADVITDSSLKVGDYAKTKAYYSGWAATAAELPVGGNTYLKISGQLLTEDGGSVINTDDGNQLYGLFTDGIYIEQFGAVADGESGTDNTDAIQACADFAGNQRIIKSQSLGVFRFESALSLYIGGIDFGFMDDASAAGESHLYCPTASIDCLTITGSPTKLKFSLRGAGQTANGVVLQSIVQGKDIDIRSKNFLGSGCKINRMWDSLVNTISVEDCGSSTEYAFSINDDGDTSNTSTFNRLQVENCTNPMFISGNTLSCTFNTIHSEGGTADTLTYAWVFGGSGCTYNSIRASSTGVAKVLFSGSNTDYNAPRIEGSSVISYLEGVNAGQLTLNNPQIEGTLTTLSAQTGHYNIDGGKINDMNLSPINGTVQGSDITTLTVNGGNADAKDLTLYDCVVTSVAPGTGSPSATFKDCTIVSYSPLAYAKFINTKVTTGDVNLSNKALEMHSSSSIEGSVQIDFSDFVMTGGSYIGGNLTEVTTDSENSRVRIDLSCFAKGGTVGALKPRTSDAYNAEFSKNMARGTGGSIGWSYSTAAVAWEAI